MCWRFVSNFSLNIKNPFIYFIHYNNPPNNPRPPPINAPVPPPNCPPTKAPPIAVENGFASVCCCPTVVGKPDAIGETKPAYCCNACAGANWACLCIASNCWPVCNSEGICVAKPNCLPLSVLYWLKAKGNAAWATCPNAVCWARGDVGVLPAPENCDCTAVEISAPVLCINGERNGFVNCPPKVAANCWLAAFAKTSCEAKPCKLCWVGAT